MVPTDRASPGPYPPRASYRLQLNKDFGFVQAADLADYLADLGISHYYASPFLKARAGSPHGYDIVDHNSFNPEVGGETDYDALLHTLRGRGMGLILDLVPNHMGVGAADNHWWLDVLENGQASPYADYFDIDWQPAKPELRHKVLLPFLGGHYGDVLERGELRLSFDAAAGSLSIDYYQHRFPVDPKCYGAVLHYENGRLDTRQFSEEVSAELESILGTLYDLPSYWRADAASRGRRIEVIPACKARLAALCRREPLVKTYIDGCVAALNGTPGDAASFEGLHRLLEMQPYRLSYWQVAGQEINYRRFFDINDLAGLRMENEEVFHATHRLVMALLTQRRLDGLRIDHIDGLYDPLEYCRMLRREAAARAREEAPGEGQADGGFYLVVEKILAVHEYLPEEWPVDGTTGYEFANLLNGLFVYPGAERYLTRVYQRFTGRKQDFDSLLYERKKVIMSTTLSSELNVLGNLLNRISEADRHARDFTMNGMRDALAEIAACFPVYRTYVTDRSVSTEDRRDVAWAVAQAKKRTPATDIGVFDFAQQVLLLDWPSRDHPLHPMAVHFAMKFQQYTAPVMAKSLEDTAFYIYNRLVSLNEVGGDPRRFAVSPTAFHYTNQERLRRWPDAMLTTSTHDNKRSEDVRARINVISEAAEAWRHHLNRWSRFNRRFKRPVDQAPSPSRNDEYLFYQTLLGTWPDEPLDEQGLERFRDRIQTYMLKAVREAKLETSWIKPNAEYEAAVGDFVARVLERSAGNLFLEDFADFHAVVSYFGKLNSLAQLLLKFTVPGMPDLYQGSELWVFTLVDPDNRYPVDYAHRRRLLDGLRGNGAGAACDGVAAMLAAPEDGRIKLYLTWRLLQLRAAHPQLFARGDYTSLQPQGDKAEHLVALVRRLGDRAVAVVVPRWSYRLCAGRRCAPLGAAIWGDTALSLPGTAAGERVSNLLTGEDLVLDADAAGQGTVRAGDLYRTLPLALLAYTYCE